MVCSLTAGQKTIVIQNKNKRNDPNRNRNADVDFTGDRLRLTRGAHTRQLIDSSDDSGSGKKWQGQGHWQDGEVRRARV